MHTGFFDARHQPISVIPQYCCPFFLLNVDMGIKIYLQVFPLGRW